MSDDNRKPLVDAAESETLRMRGNSMHGNREIPRTSVCKAEVGQDGKADRLEKVDDRTSDTHVRGKSDGPIVPKKRTNKTGQPWGEPAAESVEERGSTKGNAAKTAAHRTQGRERASIGLAGVRQAQRLTVKHPRKEPYEVMLHVRICAGGRPQGQFLPRRLQQVPPVAFLAWSRDIN